MKTWLISLILLTAYMTGLTQTIELAKNKISNYHIFIPQNSSQENTRAAIVLQDYFFRVTGVRIPVTIENKQIQSPGFFIGNTALAANDKEINALPEEGFIIRSFQKNILISGRGKKGTLYGIYAFIEKYMNCRKWDGGAASVIPFSTLSVPADINEKELPAFRYREVYLPPAFNDEYLDWHRLHRFETVWGLWGHSFFKLLSPAVYFNTHPEYFSLVDGKRKPMQLCLSNEAVLKITVDKIRKEIADNTEASYWSVSPNDDIGNCECDNCRKLDEADGGPQGSLIHFVNAVAANFPSKKFTTLAYGYSGRATIQTEPASNVIIMLSSIDAYRSRPLITEPTAAAFRNNLAQWRKKTSNIFVWDYCTQFTNYLTPFPVTPSFKPNIDFFIQQGISGVFEQGSADTYSDMPELKAYVFARLLWNPTDNADSLVNTFLKGYYGKAAPVIAEYLSLLQTNIQSHATNLDIYGNPVNNHTDYLSPANMDTYSQLMDKAEQLTENDTSAFQHIQSLRLTQEYVYLQQAKFFGKDRDGLFVKDAGNNFVIRPGLAKRVDQFIAMGNRAGIKELSEGGISTVKYAAQWQEILQTKPKENLAASANVKLVHAFAPEYPSKRERTLVDETPGYEDFSYNWLCFYGVPMEAIVDMGSSKKMNAISLRFLEDARHWIFRPSAVTVEISDDGVLYRKLHSISHKMIDEDYTVSFLPFQCIVNDTARYIKIKASNWPSLPAWRYHKNKKPMIACDEIWVE